MGDNSHIIIIHRRIEAISALLAGGNQRKAQHEEEHKVGKDVLKRRSLSECPPLVVCQSSDNTVTLEILANITQPRNKQQHPIN